MGNTFAALGVISTSMSLPSSSLRGFAVTCTAGRVIVVEKLLRIPGEEDFLFATGIAKLEA